jgi:hypothetical protein
LVHALQNHDELTYELVHFAATHRDDIFHFRGTDVTGAELAIRPGARRAIRAAATARLIRRPRISVAEDFFRQAVSRPYPKFRGQPEESANVCAPVCPRLETPAPAMHHDQLGGAYRTHDTANPCQTSTDVEYGYFSVAPCQVVN